jgi:hypothetical protein
MHTLHFPQPVLPSSQVYQQYATMQSILLYSHRTYIPTAVRNNASHRIASHSMTCSTTAATPISHQPSIQDHDLHAASYHPFRRVTVRSHIVHTYARHRKHALPSPLDAATQPALSFSRSTAVARSKERIASRPKATQGLRKIKPLPLNGHLPVQSHLHRKSIRIKKHNNPPHCVFLLKKYQVPSPHTTDPITRQSGTHQSDQLTCPRPIQRRL